MAQGKGTVTRNPLHVPYATSPYNLSLSAAPATVDLGGGNLSSVLAYNGYFPGPTIRANNGDSASIYFTNRLPEQTTVHWHGMIVPTAADGHPRSAIAPGGAYTYQYAINQRAPA